MNIQVSPLSEYFKDINGILFSKDGRCLIKYPAGITLTEYHVKDGVETIKPGAFYDNGILERVYLPETITTLKPCSINNKIEIIIKRNYNFIIPDSLGNNNNGIELEEYLMKTN